MTTPDPTPILEDPNPPSEPALTVGGIAAAVGAVLGAVTAFGPDLTETQVKAVLLVVTTVGPLVLAWLTRRKVYAPATVKALLARRRPY